MSEQLAFDLELETPEPLYFATMKEATRCRDCRKPVKGDHTYSSQGGGSMGWYVICDTCIKAKWKARYDAAPFRECGLHKQDHDEQAHCEECLDNTCPFCGIQEPNSFMVGLNHVPECFISIRDQMCMWQRNIARRAIQAELQASA
jgi:hypothetical protein